MQSIKKAINISDTNIVVGLRIGIGLWIFFIGFILFHNPPVIMLIILIISMSFLITIQVFFILKLVEIKYTPKKYYVVFLFKEYYIHREDIIIKEKFLGFKKLIKIEFKYRKKPIPKKVFTIINLNYPPR